MIIKIIIRENNYYFFNFNFCFYWIAKIYFIKIINLNTKKRPVSLVADNLEFRNIINAKIKTKNLIKFKLLYDKNNSLNKKIKLEQIRKETV